MRCKVVVCVWVRDVSRAIGVWVVSIDKEVINSCSVNKKKHC